MTAADAARSVAEKFDRRASAGFAQLAALITLLLNLVSLVWFAATLNASVSELRHVVEPLALQVQANTINIAVLKAQVTKNDRN